MKKNVNGECLELTIEEIAAMQAEAKRHAYAERTRPRTVDEGLLALGRTMLADKLADSEDKTLAIACMAFFEPWVKGVYAVGAVRTDPDTGYPYECMTAHDSTVNVDWTIKVRALWKPYHSRSAEYALPYEAPTGVHDMYKAGEYMVWPGGSVYRCKQDTAYGPDAVSDAWEVEM